MRRIEVIEEYKRKQAKYEKYLNNAIKEYDLSILKSFINNL